MIQVVVGIIVGIILIWILAMLTPDPCCHSIEVDWSRYHRNYGLMIDQVNMIKIHRNKLQSENYLLRQEIFDSKYPQSLVASHYCCQRTLKSQIEQEILHDIKEYASWSTPKHHKIAWNDIVKWQYRLKKNEK